MKDNDVWDLIPLPEEANLIDCKQIFKSKRDSKGNIERYKARLVAKGFTQKEGIDYKENFSLVSSKENFRTIMALVAHFDIELHQMCEIPQFWDVKMVNFHMGIYGKFSKVLGSNCKIDEGLSANKFKIWGQFGKLGELWTKWQKFKREGVNLEFFRVGGETINSGGLN